MCGSLVEDLAGSRLSRKSSSTQPVHTLLVSGRNGGGRASVSEKDRKVMCACERGAARIVCVPVVVCFQSENLFWQNES